MVGSVIKDYLFKEPFREDLAERSPKNGKKVFLGPYDNAARKNYGCYRKQGLKRKCLFHFRKNAKLCFTKIFVSTLPYTTDPEGVICVKTLL
jgi:hypothetical protein